MDFMSDSTKKPAIDSAKAEAFAERLLRVLNDGALCLMTAVGHRVGLFDAMRELPPSTSDEIARHTGLNERYVREWLGALVTGRVVEVDPQTNRFWLPQEHAAFLTRVAGADNIAVFSQYISLLGNVEDEIVACFKNGGGVPYSKFPRFHAVMAEDSGQSVLSSLETHIVPLVPGLADRLATGMQMLDVGCGRGRIMNRLAELYPKSRFTGIDLSSEAVLTAWQEAAEKKLRNVEFIVSDLSQFHEKAEQEAFDWVTTFDAIHDQAKPLNVLKGIYRTLKDDGIYLMQDIKGSSQVHKNIDHLLGTFLYTVSCLH
jgi:2-polyprenyl-3-methyl-5-hydroxy-6-metoxy-1,4-benzoquinol methylase